MSAAPGMGRARATPERIILEARRWIGTPYRHQASLLGVGCDCLGLVRGVWRGCIGHEPEAVPHYEADWAETGAGETLLAGAARHLVRKETLVPEPGDVVLFRWRDHLPAKHAGIASGDGRMIHAQEGAAVAEINLNPWWLRHVAGLFHFPDLEV